MDWSCVEWFDKILQCRVHEVWVNYETLFKRLDGC